MFLACGDSGNLWWECEIGDLGYYISMPGSMIRL